MAQWGVLFMLLPALVLNGGCAGAASDVSAMRTLPVIIKVEHAADETALRARLPVLEQACEVQLSYLRPMSGGAHVVQMQARSPEEALGCLRTQPDVVYVQEDKLAHPMSRAQ
jgi:hypothetical protein